ncbi:unnamed protein product [Amoebophrya sp. A25]|nr:unnamed protein product [Amoebophrya sp. A25]|eukprot:GSA25T00004622001.1
MLGGLLGLGGNKRPAASSSTAAASSSAPVLVLKKRKIVHTPSADKPSLLWVDKYRPLYLDEMDLHSDFTKIMLDAARAKELPHLLLYGPNGAGKMTRVYALLRQIFGHAVDETTTKMQTVGETSSTKFEICTKSSLYHLEINLSDVGFRDVKVVKSLLKEFTGTRPLNRAAFKVVVLKGADKLTNECQTALRRLIEVRSETNRFIFVSKSIGAMILPIQSRCFPFRLSLPSDAEIKRVLSDVLQQERMPNLIPQTNFDGIIQATGNDLRRALLKLETMVTGGNMQQVPGEPWENICGQIAQSILQGPHNPRTLLDIRSKFYTLLAATVDSGTIMTTVCDQLAQRSPYIISAIWNVASIYDVMLKKCGKEIFALEAFAARLMAIIGKMVAEQQQQMQQRR